MIDIVVTPQSVAHARELIDLGANTLVIGEDTFGLRLPYNFSKDEQREVVALGKETGTRVIVSCNAIFHNEGIDKLREYLPFLAELNVDAILLGDPGVVQTMRNLGLAIPFLYDGQVLTTTSRHINFWAKRGGVGAVLAREIPLPELEVVARESVVPVEVQVYGTTCIHQSKRLLLKNYARFVEHDDIKSDRQTPLYLSEPRKNETHYSIYEDINGTHVFSNNDLNLMAHLQTIYALGVKSWKLDSLFIPAEVYSEIVKLFIEAKTLILNNQWNDAAAQALSDKVRAVHPAQRGLDTGFLLMDPKSIQ